jgi:rod shape-determining protein MreD
MAKRIVWGVFFILIAVLLQSTVLGRLSVYIRAVPDLALDILVFSAYINGTMTGQLTGFFSGFLIDLLSVSPLGFNALVRTLIGALTGLLKGTFFLDTILLPMILCAGATAFKALVTFLLHLFFNEAVPTYSLFGLTLWIEMGLNTALAPLLFGLLKLFRPIQTGHREKV